LSAGWHLSRLPCRASTMLQTRPWAWKINDLPHWWWQQRISLQAVPVAGVAMSRN